MVDKKYAQTSIADDLLEIDAAYTGITEEKLANLPLVLVIPNKPGLDDINGKYIIDGGITMGKVSTRKTTHSKVGEIVGYKALRLKCDDEGKVVYDSENNPIIVEEKLVTKQEGLQLVQVMGAKNSYIRNRERKKHASDGTVIQVKTTAHLQPYPPKSQAFLQDGKLVLAYKVDDYGNRKVPVELNLAEQECTMNLWKIINSDYIGKRKRQKTRKSVSEIQKEQDEKLKQLRKSLVLQNRSFVNPFQKNK